ncbi:hypothetical protein BU17DRAFT_71890 [Hysterangium stoloniferum]|nr:hypothetical protein BU17DRAFT_71890 [Hysterangium stoloniferum]
MLKAVPVLAPGVTAEAGTTPIPCGVLNTIESHLAVFSESEYVWAMILRLLDLEIPFRMGEELAKAWGEGGVTHCRLALPVHTVTGADLVADLARSGLPPLSQRVKRGKPPISYSSYFELEPIPTLLVPLRKKLKPKDYAIFKAEP